MTGHLIKQLSASERPGQPQVQEAPDFSFIRRATSGKEICSCHLCNFNIFLINSKSRVMLMQICSHPKFLVVSKAIAHSSPTSNFTPEEELELCPCCYRQPSPNIFTSVMFYRRIVHKTSYLESILTSTNKVYGTNFLILKEP